MMIRKYIVPVVISIPVIIIQLTVVPFFEIHSVAPDLLLILIVLYAVRQGNLFGAVTGFILGMMIDLFSGGLLGISMFSKTAAGFVSGYFYNENKNDSNIASFNFVYFVFAAAIVDSAAHSVFTASIFNFNIFKFLFLNIVFPSIYTSVFSLIAVFYFSWRNRNA